MLKLYLFYLETTPCLRLIMPLNSILHFEMTPYFSPHNGKWKMFGNFIDMEYILVKI